MSVKRKTRERGSLFGLLKRIPPGVWGSLIIAVGGIVVAFINLKGVYYKVDTPIKATQTAEAEATQVALAIQTGEQNPDKDVYTFSVILPGEHTPPNASGRAQGKEEEKYDKVPLRIQIPSISVDAPVVQGDGWEDLKKGVGQKLGTSFPGENGVIMLSALNDVYGEIFRDLDHLQKGDQVILYTFSDRYIYIVDHIEFVSDANFEVKVDPTQPQMLVLTSPYPYLKDTGWIVVYAFLSV